MLNCRVCGAENRSAAVFCKECGSVLAEPSAVEVPGPADAGITPPAARPRNRKVIFLATAGVVVLAVVVAVVATRSDPEERTGPSLKFATAQRTDLVSVRRLPGEVTSQGEGPKVVGRLPGTITQIAPEGSKVERGKPLYAVDGQPVVLLYGSLTAFRDIGPGTTGTDVKQLESNLDALGFDVGTIDEEFDGDTEEAVKEWQTSVGVPNSGVVNLGRVFFAPAAVTVAENLRTSGAPTRDGDEIMSTVSFEKVVLVTLQEADDLSTGDEVSIGGFGRKIPATVSTVDTGERAEDSAAVATVVPTEAQALAELRDGSTVDVEVTDESREDVLAIPVTALIAREDGTYAVEVDRLGEIEIVEVEPGFFATDLVEISGLREGDRVVVP